MRAQCAADAGFSPTVTTPSGSVSVSSTYGTGWTAELVHIQNTFEVDDDFTILTCSVLVDAGVEIVVENGNILTIETSVISNCDNSMWEHIRVEPGGAVRVRLNSLVQNAEKALQIENATGNPGNFEVRGSRLMNNYVGIEVQAFADLGGHPGTIENSEIGAPSLIAPYLGEIGFSGLQATGIVYGITVGRTTSSYGAGGSFNYIHDLEYGLFFNNCLAFVQNNWIENIRTFNPSMSVIKGVGIAATGTSGGVSKELHVGFPGVGVTGINNRIEDCEVGVLAYDIDEAFTDNNEIFGSGGSTPTMDIGVWYQELGKNGEVTNNIIEEFDSIGIYVRSFVGRVLIEDNELDNPTIVTNSSCRIAGIEVRMGVNDIVDITTNTIDNVQFGMATISARTTATGNIINHRLPTGCSSAFSVGIQAENSVDFVLLDNVINSDCPSCSNTNIRAIDITECEGFLVDGNTMQESGVGGAAHGDCQGGNFTCNEVDDCTYGYGLVGMDGGGLDIGPITDDVSLLNAAGNRWLPSSTANRTIAVTSAASIPTYGTPIIPGATPDIDWRYDAGLGSSHDMAPITTFNLETSSVTPPSFRVVPLTAASSSLPCDIIPRLGGLRTTGEPSQKARNNLFAAYATYFEGVSLDNCDYFEEKSYIYNFFAGNPDWLTLGVAQDAYYQAVVEELAAANYDEWHLFFDYLGRTVLDSASMTLNGLIPSCRKEELRKEVYQLFLNRSLGSLHVEFGVSGLLPYSEAELDTLIAIAQGNPDSDGSAVYVARAIVGANSLAPIDLDGSLREQAPVTDMRKQIDVYPNPVSTQLCLSKGSEASAASQMFNIVDLQGRQLMSGAFASGCVDVSKLSAGLYHIEVIAKAGQRQVIKFSKL